MSVRHFDPQLTQRGARLIEAQIIPGRDYWRVIRAEFWDVARSAGKHHIYVDLFDERARRMVGVPLLVRWSTGNHRIFTEAKPGEQAAGNFPMTPGRNAFSIRVDDGAPSDEVTGLGMGADTPSGFNPGLHTSAFLIFQRTKAGDVPPTLPDPPTVPPTPVDMSELRKRLEAFQLRLSGVQSELQFLIDALGAQ